MFSSFMVFFKVFSGVFPVFVSIKAFNIPPPLAPSGYESGQKAFRIPASPSAEDGICDLC